MLYPDNESYLISLEDIICAICEEYSWCLPSHLPADWLNSPCHIDLFAAETGLYIVDAYLNAELGSGYEWWKNFYEFHKLAIDELEAFDYDEYKANNFKVNKLGDFPLKLETKPE